MKKYFFMVLLCSSLAASAMSYRDGAKVTSLEEFKRYNFSYQGMKCYVIEPKKTAPGKPWVWRARFDSDKNNDFDLAMLEQGWHVAQVSVKGLFGGPEAMKRFDVFYDYLMNQCGFSKRPLLEGLSRGGLPIFNWSIKNPDKVSCVYADNAVCDFKSWPGGKGEGKSWERGWKSIQELYGFKHEQEALEWQDNPIDKVHVLAQNGVRVMLGLAMKDTVVPAEENGLLIENRYNAALPAGGIKVLVLKKVDAGHHPHGFKDPSQLVRFALEAFSRNSTSRGKYK